jgi:hypothetical protein
MQSTRCVFTGTRVTMKAGTQYAISCSMTNSYVATREIDLSSHLLSSHQEPLCATSARERPGLLQRPGLDGAISPLKQSIGTAGILGLLSVEAWKNGEMQETHDARVRYLFFLIKH